MFCKKKDCLRAAALCVLGFCAASPLCYSQIYVGVNLQKNFMINTINLGEDAYWNRKIKEFYADSLKSIYEQYSNNPSGDKKWFLLGLPSDFFDVLLQCAPSVLYDRSSDNHEMSATIGSYFFRREAFLVAAEVGFGSSSLKIEQKSQIRLFSGDAPTEMQTAPVSPDGTITLSESFSILKTLTQSLFFGGNISLNQSLFLKNCFTADMLFRFGVIVKDRWYVFLILGATANKSKIEMKDENIDADDLILYYCTNQWMEEWGFWKPERLVPKDDFNTQLLTFAEEKTNIGAVGGVGAEFFVSHKISFRAQCAYAYHPCVTIASADGLASIRHFARGLRISGSFIWRF
jgi:hypothetical protein